MAFFVTLDWAADLMVSAMSVCLSVRPPTTPTQFAEHARQSFASSPSPSSPPSSSPQPIHANSHFPEHDVVDDVDVEVDGWSVRWWLLIDNVIYIIASTTESTICRMPAFTMAGIYFIIRPILTTRLIFARQCTAKFEVNYCLTDGRNRKR